MLATLLFTFLILREVKSYAEIEDNFEENQQNCICVPFWQCKEDYSGLIDDGINLIDVRMAYNSEGDTKKNSSNSTPCSGFFDVCCRIECGRKMTKKASQTARINFYGFRILGNNNEAEYAEFPWMLGILQGDTYRCGASLIHPQVAMTAAHCVASLGPFRVRAGEFDWEKNDEPMPHQDRIVNKVIIHPHYHAPSLRNDIALLILQTPFKLTENVGVICLPHSTTSLKLGKQCTAAGWGKNSFKKGTYQPTLKKMKLPLVDRQHCSTSLRKARLGPLFQLHASFICAGGEAMRDTCKGDGGSPLVCRRDGIETERYEQVGIVSWGLTCGVENTPGVYVNVQIFIDWIDFIVKRHGFDATVYKIDR